MRENLIGMKFGSLTVSSFSHASSHREAYWKCTCDCGSTITARGSKLKSGRTASCGCYRSNGLDLKGKKFGNLTATECLSEKNSWDSVWLCSCDCGASKIAFSYDLRRGRAKSCGCLGFGYKTTPKKKENPRLYRIWQSMKSRCYSERNKCYKHYGGRGIYICDEWLNSFPTFCEWARSNGYSDNLSIDRIDVDGIYEPSNCRWATNLEQQRNKRKSKNRAPLTRVNELQRNPIISANSGGANSEMAKAYRHC